MKQLRKCAFSVVEIPQKKNVNAEVFEWQITEMSEITESQNGCCWKGPLGVFLSQIPAQVRPPRTHYQRTYPCDF